LEPGSTLICSGWVAPLARSTSRSVNGYILWTRARPRLRRSRARFSEHGMRGFSCGLKRRLTRRTPFFSCPCGPCDALFAERLPSGMLRSGVRLRPVSCLTRACLLS
jgi:hypothetical protein